MTTRRPCWTCLTLMLLATGWTVSAVAGPPSEKGRNKPSLSISLAVASIVEGASTTGIVTLNNAQTGATVTVTLASSDPTVATVEPNSVSLSDTSPSAAFTVAGQPGDGDRSVTITATSDSGLSASEDLVVTGGSSGSPTVRYEIVLFQLPNDSISSMLINDVNNLGQVVGWYLDDFGQKACLYDPAIDPSPAIDLNSIGLVMPEGYEQYRLASAVAINDHQVVVGYLADAEENRVGYALDLGAETPVIDLLPDLQLAYSYGSQINENGDILGVYEDADGVRMAYLFNPGYYDGDAVIRELRNGIPLDFSDDIPASLALLGDRTPWFKLNNPSNGRPAQIGGVNSNGVLFRYTVGDAVSEEFPEIEPYWDNDFSGINDHGTFCGLAIVPVEGGKGRNATSIEPFRYDTALEVLPIDAKYVIGTPADINNSGDMISGRYVYFDEWGWLDIDVLVDGTDADLTAWFSGSPGMRAMSDRLTSDTGGYITGRLGDLMFILLPVPATQQ